MSLYIDLKYVNLVSIHLEKFSRKGEYIFNMRCPVCGDSKKSKTKCRGYIYKSKDSLRFKCHNCGEGLSLGNLIKKVDNLLYDQYILEKYKDKKDSLDIARKDYILPKYKPRKQSVDINLPCVADLKDSHISVKYLNDRKIPSEFFELFYYVEDWQEWALDITNGEYKKKYHTDTTDPRIVIPFFDKTGTLVAVQGRALFPTALRYITLKFDEESPKIFGLERWNPLAKTYITEGPIDSLFLPNCLAMAGSSVDISSLFENKKDVVFVYDNEKRNKDICNLMKKTIQNGYSICIWPIKNTLKDINDMILSGRTKKDILHEIDSNTKNGLEALLCLNNWKKC